MSIEVRNVSKNFNAFKALDNISLDIQSGELVALLGPSGCGKTTVLRMVAGFESPSTGVIRIGGVDVVGTRPNQRNIGMVFQAYALFPNLTVAQNIGFGLKMAGAPRERIASEVRRMLDTVRLGDYGDRAITQLSGGQQQRVALARAIVTNPSVLLLDEPLGALDKNLREDMQFEIRKLQQNLGITSVMVTHDQEEAMTMSDRIVVMSQGRILQIGKPDEVYDQPRTRFVAEFLGTANILACRLENATGNRLEFSVLRQDAAPSGARTQQTAHRICLNGEALPAWLRAGAIAEIAIRPEKLRIGAGNGPSLTGTVLQHVFRGAQHSYKVEVSAIGATLTVNQAADTRRGAAHAPGDTIPLSFDEDAAILLHPEDVAAQAQAECADIAHPERKAA